MRTLALKTFSFAFASATSSRSVFSPTTGNRARRTTSSGLSTAADASLKRMPSLPRTFFNSAVSCFSTRRSARALILWTRATNRSTRASVISACRDEHSAASRVIRTSSLVSRKSEGYILIARARQAATSFSEQSANNPSGSPSLRTSLSLVISVSRESRPTAPGSRLSAASRAVPASLSSATRDSSRAVPALPRRPIVRAQNVFSHLPRAATSTFSARVRPGGSIFRARHSTSRASRCRSSTSSTGQTSTASHSASAFSSATVDGRNPRASRICLRWYSAVRPTSMYFAKSVAGTFTRSATYSTAAGGTSSSTSGDWPFSSKNFSNRLKPSRVAPLLFATRSQSPSTSVQFANSSSGDHSCSTPTPLASITRSDQRRRPGQGNGTRPATHDLLCGWCLS